MVLFRKRPEKKRPPAGQGPRRSPRVVTPGLETAYDQSTTGGGPTDRPDADLEDRGNATDRDGCQRSSEALPLSPGPRQARSDPFLDATAFKLIRAAGAVVAGGGFEPPTFGL